MGQSVIAIEQVVKEFLERHWDQKSPLLLGYSGGPDSKALLYALLSHGQIPLHIAHVDHGWREESCEEALALRKEIEALGLPFYTTRLEKKTNEEEARASRLAYFQKLKEQIPFQAVLLAHQGDDLAETVLKRLFEGAHLMHLFSMRSVTTIEGLLLFRPLLQIRKGEVEEYLSLQQLVPLRDASNLDPHYLRARMRSELLPFLEMSFGKKIVKNLMNLAERSLELNEYLSYRLEQHRKKITKSSCGIEIDSASIPRIEMRFLLQELAREEAFVFSREVLETILDWLTSGCDHRMISIAGREMLIKRGRFFCSLAKKSPTCYSQDFRVFTKMNEK